MQKKSTKNIYLYPINHKFNKNISMISDDNYSIVLMQPSISMYKYYYSNIDNIPNKSDISIIINTTILNPELVQFINDFANTLNIVLFIDNNANIEANDLNIKYLIPDNSIGNYTTLDPNKIYRLENNIINKDLYEDITQKDTVNKKDQIICFLHDKFDFAKIQQYLYPLSKLNIKIFDNPGLKSAQNIGYLSELEKRDILLESKYYIHDEYRNYATEATKCGCSLINIDSDIDIHDQIKINKIENLDKTNYYIDLLEIIT